MKVDIKKELDEIRFLTVVKKDGTGRLLCTMPNIKNFERALTDAEVAHSQYLLFSVTEGALTFGDVEPGDVLSEALTNTGLVEDQAAMILSLTGERDTAARAAANANQQHDETVGELEAVRGRLRTAVADAAKLDETKKALALAVDESAKQVGELDKAGKQLVSLQAELVDTSAKLATALKDLAAAEKLLNEQTNPTNAKPTETAPATT